jgi:ABC-type multidrug transport system fused ATPase/permease subunit
MELVPGLGLYRALYEIAEYAFRAAYTGGPGLTWARLSDPGCGVRAVMIIFGAEAVVFLLLAWYVEQVAPGAAGVARHPLFFLGCTPASEAGGGKRSGWFGRRKGKGGGGEGAADGAAGGVAIGVAPPDVAEEAARAEALWAAAGGAPKALPDEAAVLVRGLRKVYPGGKVAVRELTLAVARGECFGLLGPNGAGKSTTLGMLTGFLAASGGAAAVCGHDLRADVGAAHGAMGVCPQVRARC